MNPEFLNAHMDDFATSYKEKIPEEKKTIGIHLVNKLRAQFGRVLDSVDLENITPQDFMKLCDTLDEKVPFLDLQPDVLERGGIHDLFDEILIQRRAVKWHYFNTELVQVLPKDQPFSPAMIKKLHPELHKAIADSLAMESEDQATVEWEKLRDKLPEDLQDLYQPEMLTERQKRNLESELEKVAQEIASGKLDSEEIKNLIGIFGAAHFTDILFLYYPKFKGLPVEKVRSVIGKHLGDFCLLNSNVSFNKLGAVLAGLPKKLDKNMLERLKKSLLEMAKKSVLDEYNATVKAGGKPDDFETILTCIDNFAQKLEKSADDPLMQKVLPKTIDYYTSLFKILEKKPEHLVDRLAPGRLFPDLNQLINIKETIDKKQFCNADSMGLGKSANPILVKEFYKLKNALIVAPANVLETWKSYLSDGMDSTGKQIGYFKPGQVPKVLEVSKPADMQRDDLDTFDYILISQEKFNGGYILKQELANQVLEDTLRNPAAIEPILDELGKTPQMIDAFLANPNAYQHALTLKKVKRHRLLKEKTDQIKMTFFRNHPSVNKMLVAKLSPSDVKKSEVFPSLGADLQDKILALSKKESGGYAKKLGKMSFDLRAFDEIHKLKNISKGKRGAATVEMMQNAKKTDYMIALTGTPAPNKAGDLAIILKMLYPNDYKEVANEELTESIIKGEVLDLRDRLMYKMQMKELEDSVEIPELDEEYVEIEMSPTEKLMYEVLVEEDEVTPMQKISTMRHFSLNPSLFKPAPGIESSKLARIREDLAEQFKTKKKGVIFVNGFIENIIRGEDYEKTILPHLGIPKEQIHVYHGDMSKSERKEIQRRVNETDEQGLYLISGQTADVGINLYGADFVMFLNEDWSKPITDQQIKRVHRYGVKDDVWCRKYYCKGTIEEGMKVYSELKHKAILKILKGVPLSEIEQKFLHDAEKGEIPDLSVNKKLAETYLSAWLQLSRIWGEVKNIGESALLAYLLDAGDAYAESYKKMGRRSYQANNARVNATILNRIIEADQKTQEDYTVLDLASGPEMLQKHANPDLADRIVNVDINPKHFLHEEEVTLQGFLDEEKGVFDQFSNEAGVTFSQFVDKEEFNLGQLLHEEGATVKQFLDESGVIPDQFLNEDGLTLWQFLDNKKCTYESKTESDALVGSFINLPFQDSSVDYCNLGMALHYARLNRTEKLYEPFKFLYEANRVLKEGGKVVISNIFSQEFREEEDFYQVAKKLGFEVVTAFTGEAYNEKVSDVIDPDNPDNQPQNGKLRKRSNKQFYSSYITLQKCKCIGSEKKFDEIMKKLPAALVNGSKFKQSVQQLSSSKEIIHNFTFQNQLCDIALNEADQNVCNEEGEIVDFAYELMDQYGGLEKIPHDVVTQHGYGRFDLTLKGDYVLFKELSNQEGIVTIKDDRKEGRVEEA